jgi:hypothetical protein
MTELREGDTMLKSVETIGAKDHAEAIAIFRAQVIAPMCVGNSGAANAPSF